jgi:hypothetical protein
MSRAGVLSFGTGFIGAGLQPGQIKIFKNGSDQPKGRHLHLADRVYA